MEGPLNPGVALMPLDEPLWRQGRLVVGLDEAGRGALAGPVVVGAVILPPGHYPYIDSKRITYGRRVRLLARLYSEALALSIGVASAVEIDRMGILRATHLAAKRALGAIVLGADQLITDYLFLKTSLPVIAVAKAEDKSPSVAAASILAKVWRDARMREADTSQPGYGFARHKGYGTSQHLQALADLGPSCLHRQSFAPVAALLHQPLSLGPTPSDPQVDSG